MKKPALFFSIFLVSASILSSCKTESQPKDIPISVWYGAQLKVSRADLTAARQAGFNRCIMQLRDGSQNELALGIADSLGIELVLADEAIDRYVQGDDSTLFAVDSMTSRYIRYSSFKGPLLFQKPGIHDFSRLADLADYFHSKHHSLEPLIQALPNYSSPARLDTSIYEDYLALFCSKLKPSSLNVEYFGIKDNALYEQFFQNLRAQAKQSQKSGIPFNAFALVVPFDDHPEPVHSHIRLQLYSGLAYGAKGVQYYSFWPPEKNSSIYGDALMSSSGELTKSYWDARAINSEIQRLAPTLMGLTSTGVAFSEPLPPGGKGLLPGMHVVKIDAQAMLAGFFKDRHGARYVMLVNTDMNYGKLATVTFAASVTSITEIPKNHMPPEEHSWTKDETDRAAMLLFRAGDGRLFRIFE